MLSDKQSLILCGLMTAVIFITGLFEALDNFVVLTILTIIFLAIIINLIATKSFKKEEEKIEK